MNGVAWTLPTLKGVSGEKEYLVKTGVVSALSRESLRVALLREVRGDVGQALENRGF